MMPNHSDARNARNKTTLSLSLAKELEMSKSSVANYLNSSEKKVISEFIDPN